MAKKSLVERELKRAKLEKRCRAKRNKIKKALHNAYIAGDKDQVMLLQLDLQKLPVNSGVTRQQRRCQITGRPRGVYRKFGLGRNKLREFVMSGLVPGVKKASW